MDMNDNRPVMVECQEPHGKHAQRVVAFTERGFCLMRRQRDGKLSMSIAAVRLPDELAEAILDVVRRQNEKGK
jgi:hypothetical protein